MRPGRAPRAGAGQRGRRRHCWLVGLVGLPPGRAARYFSRTSSKNLSARGSFDCPSQNIACLRTTAFLLFRATSISFGTPVVLGQLAEREDRAPLDLGFRVAIDRFGDRRDGLGARALSEPEQRIGPHSRHRDDRVRWSTSDRVAAVPSCIASAITAGLTTRSNRSPAAGMVLTSEVSHATLSSGFTPSSQTTGRPPASISQSGVAVRSLTMSAGLEAREHQDFGGRFERDPRALEAVHRAPAARDRDAVADPAGVLPRGEARDFALERLRGRARFDLARS